MRRTPSHLLDRVRLVAASTSLGLIASVAAMTADLPSDPTPPVDRQVVQLAEEASEGWTATVDLPVDAEMVAFTWDEPTTADIRVRGQRGDQSWTDEVHLHGSPGEAPDAPEADGAPAELGRGAAGPAWLGADMRSIEITLEGGRVRGLELHAIDTEPLPTDGMAAAAGMPAAPGIISRAQWGANESWRSHNSGCATPKYARNAHYAIIHHTAGSNSYSPSQSAAILRGIYEFHVFGRGWCDVAYNLLVDRYGQIFEGRAGGVRDAVIGGHTGGFNTGSFGVAVMGSFDSSSVPSSTYTSLRRLLAFKLGHHGIDPKATTRILTVSHPSSRYPSGQLITMPTVAVHGDYSQTGCPGANLRALVPRLRSDLAQDLAVAPYDPRLVGDWDGDGTDTIATYANGGWSLRSSNTRGPATQAFSYGYRGAVPVVGDWDGDGRDGIGVYDDGWWLLRNTPSPGPPEIAFQYGYRGAVPVVGDWDGDGRDGVGVYDGGWWLLRQSPTSGGPQLAFSYGWRGPTPVVGDWDGDERDGIGVWNVGGWSLRETASPGLPQRSLHHGGATDRPAVGDWTAKGHDGVGLVRGAYWYQSATVTAALDRVFWF